MPLSFDPYVIGIKVLEVLMIGAILLLFDELNAPQRPPPKHQKTGIVRWDESGGEKKESKQHD